MRVGSSDILNLLSPAGLRPDGELRRRQHRRARRHRTCRYAGSTQWLSNVYRASALGRYPGSARHAAVSTIVCHAAEHACRTAANPPAFQLFFVRQYGGAACTIRLQPRGQLQCLNAQPSSNARPSAVTGAATYARFFLRLSRLAGTVGVCLPCVEMRLESVPDMNYDALDATRPGGEVLIRGPQVRLSNIPLLPRLTPLVC